MALAAGTRLGAYEILGLLGAGGMGEVYRGRDNSLNRDVALKVLPDAFATDPDRVARFQREAKTLASVNHPNIGGARGTLTRVIADPTPDRQPVWTPDGQRITFSSTRTGIRHLFSQAANGTGTAEKIVDVQGR